MGMNAIVGRGDFARSDRRGQEYKVSGRTLDPN